MTYNFCRRINRLSALFWLETIKQHKRMWSQSKLNVERSRLLSPLRLSFSRLQWRQSGYSSLRLICISKPPTVLCSARSKGLPLLIWFNQLIELLIGASSDSHLIQLHSHCVHHYLDLLNFFSLIVSIIAFVSMNGEKVWKERLTQPLAQLSAGQLDKVGRRTFAASAVMTAIELRKWLNVELNAHASPT